LLVDEAINDEFLYFERAYSQWLTQILIVILHINRFLYKLANLANLYKKQRDC
jgi:hypothetical protein